MGCFEIGALWLMVTIISIHADTSADGIQAECLGNSVQFILPGSLSAGGRLEIYAVNDTQTVLLTPHLAAQCGYTQKSDPLGNTIVSASLQSCYAENQGDQEFRVAMQFKLYEFPTLSEKVHEVFKFCSHTMTSREILCETNFMEASIRKKCVTRNQDCISKTTGMYNNLCSSASPAVIPNLQLWKILLYTPEEKSFDKETLQAMGYNVQSSPTRLVMRSPHNMVETFVQNVDSVDMMVFKSVALFRDRWMMALVESTAACPISGASVVGQMIYWQVPLHITPLMSLEVEILEVHMGINGRRLTPDEMESRNYAVTFKESHVVVEIPIGASDGYYKSHVLENQCHVSYTIEPMLELLWKEGQDKTTYKVLFPITTPLTPWSPQVKDYTQLEQRVFDVLLGYLLPDVELVNITFGSELLTVSEIIIKGINLQEHSFPNNTKAFALQVPFSEPYVQIKTVRPDLRTYVLDLVFGFVILPERTAFSHSVVLEASLADIDMVYRLFYHDGDYPVLKFLKQPLYFEVGMDHSKDSRAAVVLENCWATLSKDKESNPRWDLIVDGCASPKDPEHTIFHPVTADDRVDIPNHFKRFEVKTFALKEDDESSESEGDILARRVFVHCDVIICHVEDTADGRCYKKCLEAQNPDGSSSNRVRRSSGFSEEALQHVSIGPILLI
ncbi:hypothetical protein cypCar_00038644 [Cyprinus carpio]|nr:hypothetical protein cypCar_00038644 [Cyprinus carpio]